MYKIKLQQFEGPLDLLLFFIKRDELDIYDIPISHITKEFMAYLNIMEKLDLEVAGDFILMASTLMQIKVRMLLPKEVDEEGEVIDPRTDLVNALLEYKKYKEVTEELSYFEGNQRKINYRGYFKQDEKENPPDVESALKNITLFDLIKAFQKALEEMPNEPVHQIRKINITIDQQIEYLLERTKNGRELPFSELMHGMKQKIKVIVTFIAMLELVKIGKIGLKEAESFNGFSIYGLENG